MSGLPRTPGPWRFGPRSKTNLYSEQTGQYVGTFLLEEDAALGRAAPDLLEALEELAEIAEGPFPGFKLGPGAQKARVAIARAKGEA